MTLTLVGSTKFNSLHVFSHSFLKLNKQSKNTKVQSQLLQLKIRVAHQLRQTRQIDHAEVVELAFFSSQYLTKN